MSEAITHEEREAFALLRDGDVSEFDQPFDTLAVLDSIGCIAGRDDESNGIAAASFWHARARRRPSCAFFAMFRFRSEVAYD